MGLAVLAQQLHTLGSRYVVPYADKLQLLLRQCSSGLQAIADVAASIKAGYYTIGIGAGVEQMSTDGMSWKGSVNPRVMEKQEAQDCLLPMGEAHTCFPS